MKLVRYNPYPDYLAACHGQDVGLLLHFLHSHLYMYQHQMEHSRDDAGTCHEQRGVTLRLTHSASLGLADSFLISLRNLSRVTECDWTRIGRGAAFEIVAASLGARGAFNFFITVIQKYVYRYIFASFDFPCLKY